MTAETEKQPQAQAGAAPASQPQQTQGDKPSEKSGDNKPAQQK